MQESQSHMLVSASPGDIEHIVRPFVGVNLFAIAVAFIILGHFVFLLQEQHTIKRGTLMSGALVVFVDNYTVSICWFYQYKLLLILVQIISILW